MHVFTADSPHRKSNRGPFHDYSAPGCYSVTICVQDRICYLGEVVRGRMIENECGRIVRAQWEWAFQHFSGVATDEFVVMPNHVHGIVRIEPVPIGSIPNVGTILGLSLRGLPGRDDYNRRHNVLSKTINAFKTTSSKHIHAAGNGAFRWQRSFHDRIIRDDAELDRIRCYIRRNPAKMAEPPMGFRIN